MNKIIEALNENLRVIYRKAVDADNALKALQADGKGKHKAIFDASSGFTSQSKRFVPYVEELAGEVSHLSESDEQTLNKALPALVKKIELMLNTLQQFKETLK